MSTPRWRLCAAAIVLAAFAALGSWNCTNKKNVADAYAGKLVVRFLDIGQGDAELVTLPDGENILIDAGDHGAPTVRDLKDISVQNISIAVATHPHSDHIGEMRTALQQFSVKEFWDSGFPYSTATYQHMLDEIEQQHIPLTDVKAGETRSIDGVMLEVLHPEQGNFIDDNPNNASVVIRLTYGKEKFLFAGDAEVESWEQMISLHRNQLEANVLKAAHHGSSNGTTAAVLAAVNPEYVVISCAKGNDYHHPHPKVMRLLRGAAERTQILRTDLEGTITMVSDGNSIQVQTERTCTPDMLYKTGDEVAAASTQ
jgi:beta-lactamase superfamily II metal-dependent hydrolase